MNAQPFSGVILFPEPTPPRRTKSTSNSWHDESQAGQTASVLRGKRAASAQRKILKLLKADAATHIDEIVELLELDLSSSETFAALFELELAGKVKQMPGKNFVKSF